MIGEWFFITGASLFEQSALNVFLFLLLPTIGLVYYLSRPVNSTHDLTGAKGAKFFKLSRGCLGSPREHLRGRLRNESDFTKVPLFPNGWFGPMETPDIAVNQVQHVAALGENFAVFRNSNGKVHVVNAYCPHLGANMGIGGVVKNDCIQCPFHGSQFDGETGKCTSIPYAEKVPEFAKVQTWRSIEVNHIIFVWYHADGEEPSYEPQPIKEIINEDYRFVGRKEFLVEAHIEDVMVNNSDYSHFDMIHIPALLGGNYLDGFKRSWVSSLFDYETSPSWKVDPDFPHIAWIRSVSNFRFLKMPVPIASTLTVGKMVGPGYIEMHVPSNFGNARSTVRLLPVAPFVLRITMRTYTPPFGALYGQSILKALQKNIELETIIFNYQKIKMNKLNVIKEDGPIPPCRRWYSQFYSKSSRCFNYKDTLTW